MLSYCSLDILPSTNLHCYDYPRQHYWTRAAPPPLTTANWPNDRQPETPTRDRGSICHVNTPLGWLQIGNLLKELKSNVLITKKLLKYIFGVKKHMIGIWKIYQKVVLFCKMPKNLKQKKMPFECCHCNLSVCLHYSTTCSSLSSYLIHALVAKYAQEWESSQQITPICQSANHLKHNFLNSDMCGNFTWM